MIKLLLNSGNYYTPLKQCSITALSNFGNFDTISLFENRRFMSNSILYSLYFTPFSSYNNPYEYMTNDPICYQEDFMPNTILAYILISRGNAPTILFINWYYQPHYAEANMLRLINFWG